MRGSADERSGIGGAGLPMSRQNRVPAQRRAAWVARQRQPPMKPWHPQEVVDLQQGDSKNPQLGHCDATHAHEPLLHDRLLVQAYADPQPPQLLLSVLKSTQAPLHRV